MMLDVAVENKPMTVLDHDKASMWEKLEHEAQWIANLISSAKQHLEVINKALPTKLNVVTGDTVKSTTVASRIVGALEIRYRELLGFLQRRDDNELSEALSILEQRLVVADDPFNSVLDSEPIPPIDRDQWVSVLDQLFSRLHRQLKTAA